MMDRESEKEKQGHLQMMAIDKCDDPNPNARAYWRIYSGFAQFARDCRSLLECLNESRSRLGKS